MHSECVTCGRPTSHHDRHVRFQLPDLMVGIALGPDDLWMSHADALTSTMLQVNGVGAFVRASVPIKLTGGYVLTYGVWVQVEQSDLHRALEVWWAPSYAHFTLTGSLANSLPPWDLLGAPVDIKVRSVDEAPYCTSSSHPELESVLSDEWPHETVLAALPVS